jgi:hypothetical protein
VNLLLALAAVAVERVHQHGVGARELVRLVQILAAPLERLFAKHRAPVALHRGIVRREQLSRDHALDLVFGSNSDEG